MKNFIYIILFLATIHNVCAQSYSNWKPINSPHGEIKNLTVTCDQQILTSDDYKLWHSPDYGHSWLPVDYPFQNVPPAGAVQQKVFMNHGGVVVVRKSGYPGTAWVMGWNCANDSLSLNGTYPINSNMYDWWLDVFIHYDKDEFVQKYVNTYVNPPHTLANYHSTDGQTWSPITPPLLLRRIHSQIIIM